MKRAPTHLVDQLFQNHVCLDLEATIELTIQSQSELGKLLFKSNILHITLYFLQK